jgi:hypothetical protein
MILKKILLRPELSAQGIRKNPNPILRKAIEVALEAQKKGKRILIVDCGCGQLRNVQTLLSISSNILLVDTPYQLNAEHDFYGEKIQIKDFVRKKWSRKKIDIMSSEQFKCSSVKADLIFSINVLDVTPQRTRQAILRSCYNNLTDDGLFVAIVPRNDTWTLRICAADKQYQDGFAFAHSKGFTYYRNWHGTTLHDVIDKVGFCVYRDLSIHRQVCVICKRRS